MGGRGFDPWIAAATDRALVRLDDGRTGRLQFVAPRSRLAAVRVGGRTVRVPVGTLTIAAPEAADTPPAEGTTRVA